MEGPVEDTVILHWNESKTCWEKFAWSSWVRLRSFIDGRLPELPGAEPGVHFFLVCMLGKHGALADVIPHKYAMSEHGHLIQAFDGLEEEERAERLRLGQLVAPTLEDTERHKELCDRGFAVNLPPARTVSPLLKSIPGLTEADPGAACWRFLSAMGISRANRQFN